MLMQPIVSFQGMELDFFDGVYVFYIFALETTEQGQVCLCKFNDEEIKNGQSKGLLKYLGFQGHWLF